MSSDEEQALLSEDQAPEGSMAGSEDCDPQPDDGIKPSYPMMRWPTMKADFWDVIRLFDAAEGTTNAIEDRMLRVVDIEPVLSVLGLKPALLPEGAMAALEEEAEPMVDCCAATAASSLTGMTIAVRGLSLLRLLASLDAPTLNAAKSHLDLYQWLYEMFVPGPEGISVNEANATLRVMGFPLK